MSKLTTQIQFEKTIGVFNQNLIFDVIPINSRFSRKFDKYSKSPNGLFDWIFDEVKHFK